MNSQTLHQVAEKLSRSRGISIREARSLLSQRGHAEKRRQRAQRTREPAPLVGAWWNRDLREE